MELSKKILIVANAAVLIMVFVFNGLSGSRSKLFPATVGDISTKFPTEITPSGSTFAIWGFIYFFQAAWTIYTVWFLFRKDDPDFLPSKFYIFFIISSLCNISWVLVWSHEQIGVALGFLIAMIIFLALSLDAATSALLRLQGDAEGAGEKPCPYDVWVMRLPVKNGLAFYTAWVTIATCLNFVVVMHYRGHVNKDGVTSAALAFLLCLTVIWFCLESFLFKERTRFLFSEYVVLVVALSGVLQKQWTDGKGNQAFTVAILVIASILLILRIILIILQEKSGFQKKAKSELP